jgi:hypothetical protein
MFFSHIIEKGLTSYRNFSIVNPNLDDSVNMSFVANAPMTDSNAAEALEAAESTCENASP